MALPQAAEEPGSQLCSNKNRKGEKAEQNKFDHGHPVRQHIDNPLCRERIGSAEEKKQVRYNIKQDREPLGQQVVKPDILVQGFSVA